MEQKIEYDSFDIEEFIQQNNEKLTQEKIPDVDEMLKNAKDGKQGNGFVFTYNNFTHTPEQMLELLQTLSNISFTRFQIEKATDTGTIHYQGYMHFSKRVYWGAIRRAFIKMGLHRVSHRNRIATPKKAADYCKKVFDEETGKQTKLTEPVYEFGELDIRQGERSDLSEIVERVKQGASDKELLDEYPTQFFRFKKHIESVRKTIQESEFESKKRNMTVFYIYGSPRTWKTTYIMETKYQYKDICRLSTKYDKKWLFENYKGQNAILYDEYDSQIEITEMNDYLDGFPQQYHCRNEDKVAMNTIVYIVSNLPLSAQYPTAQKEKPKVYEAFCKRIHHIINWDNSQEQEYFKQHGISIPKASQAEQMVVVSGEDLPW